METDFNNDFGQEFELITKEDYFVDKTKLIEEINGLINTTNRYLYIKRPHFFGKSVNALMLASYYSKDANMKYLFDTLEIKKCLSYEKHQSKYNVVFISFEYTTETYKEYIGYLEDNLKKYLISLCPSVNENLRAKAMLKEVYKKTQTGFIFILDDMDYILRHNLFTEDDQKDFILYLEGLLGNRYCVKLVFATGILPMPIPMFREYNIINDNIFQDYFGLSQSEVENLCKQQREIELVELEEWYGGYYNNNGEKVYTTGSVIDALDEGFCSRYYDGITNEIVECIRREENILIKEQLISIFNLGSLNITNLNPNEFILNNMIMYGILTYNNGILSIPNMDSKCEFVILFTKNIFSDIDKSKIDQDLLEEISERVKNSNI